MVNDLERRFDTAVSDARSAPYPVEAIAARARSRGRRRAVAGAATVVMAIVVAAGAFAALSQGGGANREVAVRSLADDAEIVVTGNGSCLLSDSRSGSAMEPAPPDGRVCIRLVGWGALDEVERARVAALTQSAGSCAEDLAVATLYEIVADDPARTEAWLLIPCEIDASEVAEELQLLTAQQLESDAVLRFEPVAAP